MNLGLGRSFLLKQNLMEKKKKGYVCVRPEERSSISSSSSLLLAEPTSFYLPNQTENRLKFINWFLIQPKIKNQKFQFDRFGCSKFENEKPNQSNSKHNSLCTTKDKDETVTKRHKHHQRSSINNFGTTL